MYERLIIRLVFVIIILYLMYYYYYSRFIDDTS